MPRESRTGVAYPCPSRTQTGENAANCALSQQAPAAKKVGERCAQGDATSGLSDFENCQNVLLTTAFAVLE